MLIMLTGFATASYRIELKSGKNIVTSYYWEEDGQIMFYQYDGVVGYPADKVERIYDTDEPEPVETPRQEPEMDEESPQEIGGAEQEDGQELFEDALDKDALKEVQESQQTDRNSEEFKKKVAQYQKELKTIHREIVILVDRHYSAMRDDLQVVMDETRERIYELQERQEKLRIKVQNLYGELPEWWYDITEDS